MDTIDKLANLSSLMDLEPAEETGCPKISEGVKGLRKKESINISEAVMPGGKRIRLLKTLLTSACERNCYYCPFRAGRDFRRATFTPDEMAQTFISLHRSGIAEGIFLSSGIAGGGIRTQDRMIATAEILRNKLGYRGYLHLKFNAWCGTRPGRTRHAISRPRVGEPGSAQHAASGAPGPPQNLYRRIVATTPLG